MAALELMGIVTDKRISQVGFSHRTWPKTFIVQNSWRMKPSAYLYAVEE